jgi:hypothetical protein
MRSAQKSKSSDHLKETTIVALERVVDPLVYLMFDAGITVREFCRLIRERAVRSAVALVKKETGRSSNSRVAIITGLARAEVARILNVEDVSSGTRPGRHPARRVLAAWYDNRRFLGANGDPAVLPIFGRRRSFEQLVAMNSGGIPVRAMLDQLAQINAVEILAGQRVKAKSRVPIFKGMTSTAIANLGERAGDLLRTLGGNIRGATNPLFEETAVLNDVDVAAVPLVRRQISEQGGAFIDGATSLLSRSRTKRRRSILPKSAQCRVGVTVYYFQDELAGDGEIAARTNYSRRKNLQRHHSKSKMGHKIKPSGRGAPNSTRTYDRPRST